MDPFQKMANHHRTTHYKIQSLYLAFGEAVTSDQITEFGIDLACPVWYGWDSEEHFMIYFLDYVFIQINIKQYKIQKHEIQF